MCYVSRRWQSFGSSAATSRPTVAISSTSSSVVVAATCVSGCPGTTLCDVDAVRYSGDCTDSVAVIISVSTSLSSPPSFRFLSPVFRRQVTSTLDVRRELFSLHCALSRNARHSRSEINRASSGISLNSPRIQMATTVGNGTYRIFLRSG